MPILRIPQDWAPASPQTEEEHLARRIELIERASGGTLPTKVVWALAEDPTSPAVQLSRAAVQLARYFDLRPDFLLQRSPEIERALARRRVPGRWYVDPVTGGPVSWATAKRIVRPYEPARVAAALSSIVEAGTPAGLLARVVKALAPISGEDVPAERVLGAVAAIAGELRTFGGQADVFIERLATNMEVVSELGGLDPMQRISVAHVAAKRGIRFEDASQVAAFLFPEAREVIEMGQRFPSPEEVAAARARAERGEAVRLEELGAMPIQASLGQEIVAALRAPDMLRALQEAQDDYVAAAKEIAEAYEIPFTDSIVGRVIGRTLDYVNRPFSVAMRGLWGVWEAIGPYVGPHTGPHTAAILPDEFGNRDMAEVFGDMVRDWGAILAGSTTHVKEMEELGIPPWFSTLVDLVVLFRIPDLDPLIAAGRLGRMRVELRTMMGLAERGRSGEWAERVHSFLHSRVGRFGDLRNVTPAEYLLREADRARNPAAMYDRVTLNFRTTVLGHGIHPQVQERIWRFAQATRRAGMRWEDRVRGVNELFLYGFGVRVDGPLVREMERVVAEQRARVAEVLSKYAPGMRDPTEHVRTEIEVGTSVLQDAELTLINHGPIMLEIPHLASPIVRAEHALRISGIGDSVPGRALRALFQTHPKRTGARFEFDIEDMPGATRDFERYLLATKVYSPEEIARAKLRFAEAIRPDNAARTFDVQQVLATYESETIYRQARKYGLLPRLPRGKRDELIRTAAIRGWSEALRELGLAEGYKVFAKAMQRFERAWRPNPNMVFGGLPGPQGAVTTFREPILVTQRPNAMAVMDPLLFERGIAETIGTARKIRASIIAALGGEVPKGKAVKLPLRKVLDSFADVLIRDLFLSWYKPLIVVRGAYVLRVPVIEEHARFLATLGAASRLESGRYGARVLTFTDSLFGRGPRLEIPVQGPGGQVITVSLPRPGMLPREPLANSVVSRFALASERTPLRAWLEQVVSNRWGLIERSQPEYVDWWYNALAHQYGLDPMGRRVLAHLAEGRSDDHIVERIMEWMRDPAAEGPRYVHYLMGRPLDEVPAASLELEVRRVIAYARHLTAGSPQLAEAAASGMLQLDDLLQIPAEARPVFVHGPMGIEGPLGHGLRSAQRLLDGVRRWILQEPTNRLVRQPYFNGWYDRMLRAMVQVHKEQVGTPLSPELLAGFKSRARQFGVDQVRRIMFDFTREGRLDEVTRNVLMFVQPFLEWPVVWGRIVKMNPAVIGYASRLQRAATESGFVREDEDTGELVVPLSWWAFAAPLLAALTGGRLRPVGEGGGWELVAPVSSFNLFAQSAFPVPMGKIAGTIPLPMPSVSPPALWAIQRLVAHDALVPGDLRADIKARLSAWLFQYGEVNPARPYSLLPPYLRQIILAAMPEWVEQEHNLAVTNFLTLQEAMGITPETIMADHPDWTREQAQQHLIAIARRQAREFALLRAFFAWVFPAAPRIGFPTQDLEREWSDLLAHHTIDEAKEIWFRRHPDLRLVTVARTMWSQENPTPVPIPPSDMVAQFLETRGARRFAKDHPRWVWAIISGDLARGEFDIGNFFAQIARGQREVLTPTAFLREADVQAGWDAYFMERERWVAWQDAHPNLGPGDPPYEAERLEHERALDEIGELYPTWRAEYDVIQRQGTDPLVLAEAQRLAKDKMFVRTEVGKGLRAYMQLRQEIEGELRRLNVASVRTVAAERLGITERYDQGVERIIQRFPAFKTAYRLFFYSDLQKVETKGEARLGEVPSSVMDQQITPWWETFEELRQAPDLATTEAQRSAAYEELRAFVQTAYERFGPHNPMRLRWETYDPFEKARYAVSLIGRGYWYLSRFDRELLGDRTSERAEEFWSLYNQLRAAIADRRLSDPSFSAAEAYRRLDAWVRERAAADPIIAEQVERANTWGYTLERMLPIALAGSPGQARPYWDALFDATREIQAAAARYQLTGEGAFDPEARVAYAALRKVLAGYIEELKETSVVFARQWDELERATGPEPLLDALMPETWFPVGGYGGST